MFILFIVVIVLGLWILRSQWSGQDNGAAHGGAEHNGAREILDRRYVSGEIDADEYAQRRATLGL